MVLSGGQVFLVFGILCGFLSVSMIFLVVELAHHKMNHHFKEWKDTMPDQEATPAKVPKSKNLRSRFHLGRKNSDASSQLKMQLDLLE
jgi:hypothetical protein